MKITDLQEGVVSNVVNWGKNKAGDIARNLSTYSPQDGRSVPVGHSAKMSQAEKDAYNIGLKDFTSKVTARLQDALNHGIVGAQSQSQPQTSAAASASYQQPNRTAANQQKYNALKSKVSGVNAKTRDAIAQNPPRISTAGAQQPAPAVSKTASQASTSAPSEPSMAELIKKRQQQGMTESKSITNHYELFDRLIESKILNEQTQSIENFLNDIIERETHRFIDSQGYEAKAHAIAKAIDTAYGQTKKIDQAKLKELWDVIWAWHKLGRQDAWSVATRNRGQRSQRTTEIVSKYDKLGDFLKSVAANPDLLSDPTYKLYTDAIKELAKKI